MFNAQIITIKNGEKKTYEIPNITYTELKMMYLIEAQLCKKKKKLV